jgi:hypothetical protein
MEIELTIKNYRAQAGDPGVNARVWLWPRLLLGVEECEEQAGRGGQDVTTVQDDEHLSVATDPA